MNFGKSCLTNCKMSEMRKKKVEKRSLHEQKKGQMLSEFLALNLLSSMYMVYSLIV